MIDLFTILWDHISSFGSVLGREFCAWSLIVVIIYRGTVRDW